ncbi:MAG: amidohydrolase [Kiritimatiellia bacterium]|jgi:5-methylthioadenosine/S-adenosylhomocysteine deaminase
MIYVADIVVTQNDARDIFERGAVAIDGARIVEVGPADEILARRPGGRVLDLGEAAILPGLVNGHTHIAMSALRGYSDDKALMDWLQQDIFPAEARLTPAMVRTASLLSCAELIRTGCTAFFDMYMLEDAVFAAVDEAGLRAVLGENVTQFYPGLSAATEAEHFDRIRRYAREWKGHPRIRGAVAPHAVYTTNPGLLRRCRDLADEIGFGFGLHLSETVGETEGCVAEHGMRPTAYCRSLGILREDTTLFHMVDVDDADLDAVASCGCAIVHNPASNMKLASGVAPIEKMLARGIPVSIGTDGPASNNAQNLFRDLYLASLLQKVAARDPLQLPAQTALDLATHGGAAALHEPDIGSLEPGKQADFIALDLAQPNLQPVHSIVSNLVYAATGLENRLTVVAGRVLYQDGDFKTLDYAKLRQEMKGMKLEI